MQPGAHALRVGIDAYDLMIGRYSAPLAVAFADLAGVAPPQRALDVGCGPGALTSQLVRRLGAGAVAAIEPSPAFVEECRRRNPGADVRIAAAEELPFADATFDAALAQLTFNFFSDGDAAAAELRRVLVPGGIAAGCVWDVAGGMEVLEVLYEGARAAGVERPSGPGSRFTRAGEIGVALRDAGFSDVVAGALDVRGAYAGADDLWAALATGTGPAGAFFQRLTATQRDVVRRHVHDRFGARAVLADGARLVRDRPRVGCAPGRGRVSSRHGGSAPRRDVPGRCGRVRPPDRPLRRRGSRARSPMRAGIARRSARSTSAAAPAR